MAMAMALRRLSSSIDKPIRPLIRSTSCYMVTPISPEIEFHHRIEFCRFWVSDFCCCFVQSSLPSEAVDDKEKSRVTVSLIPPLSSL